MKGNFKASKNPKISKYNQWMPFSKKKKEKSCYDQI